MRYVKHIVLAAALTGSLGACAAYYTDRPGYYSRPQYVYSSGYYTPRYTYYSSPSYYGYGWRYYPY
jgi:hypothetical protein